MNQMIELCEHSSLYEKRSDSLYKKTKMVRLLVYIYSLNSLGEKS